MHEPPIAPTPIRTPERPARLYQTEAIVLSRMALNEADRILTVFTPAHGKYRVIAKGARRPTSRLGPHLEYFTHARLHLSRGRELDVVTGAETIAPHLSLRTDLTAFGHASHMAEVILRLTEERQENAAAYHLLVKSLALLDEGVDPFAVTRHFELAAMTMLGYRPELYRCVECQRDLEAEPNPFVASRGGFLCPVCRHGTSSGPRLSVNAQKYLRTLDRHGLAAAVRLRVPETLREELEAFASSYLRHVAERDLHSLRVWHAVTDTPSSGPPTIPGLTDRDPDRGRTPG
ncbi:MAG: DNA recombination and repair protein RecO [uncultured Thermomicrobiales bacterium]|uniref:DNA repair protein RecO n=1 Tax=uncultured Thermomicrobiales bacterium TaxID=1645740 RepID=A0A6J4UI95_9BACT|nr:MAG: DNA recombination and repair protein RecO [uncultured Thermomicrobiales bacterium]